MGPDMYMQTQLRLAYTLFTCKQACAQNLLSFPGCVSRGAGSPGRPTEATSSPCPALRTSLSDITSFSGPILAVSHPFRPGHQFRGQEPRRVWEGWLTVCRPAAGGGLAVMDERSHNEFSRDLGDRTLSPHLQPKEILLLAREVIEPPDNLPLSAFCPHFRCHYSRNLPRLTRTSPPGLPASHVPLRSAGSPKPFAWHTRPFPAQPPSVCQS